MIADIQRVKKILAILVPMLPRQAQDRFAWERDLVTADVFSMHDLLGMTTI